MNYLKNFTVTAIASLLLFSNAFLSKADDPEGIFNIWNVGSKEEIFKMAKEQDRLVLVLIGRHSCGICQAVSLSFTNNSQLRKIIDENYVTWFSDRDDPIAKKEVETYTASYDLYTDATGLAKNRWCGILENAGFECYDTKLSLNIPVLCVINPEDPEEDYTVFWKKGSKTVQQLLALITTPDLFSGSSVLNVDSVNSILFFNKAPKWLSGQKLQWYKNKDEVFRLAKEQNKYIFKLVGKSTSPKSKKLLKQLYESSIAQLLIDNYILWYSDDTQETQTLSGDEDVKSLPYISIIYPETPDELLEEKWGIQEDEALEDMLKAYTVSNEKILPNPAKVAIWGNTLFISNQTSNEQITIYSLTGQNVTSFYKNDFTASIDVSKFPKGVLIIRSSAGWSAKVINP